MAETKLQNAPDSVLAFCNKGVAALERDNLDYAMDMFESALHIEPRLLEIRRLLRNAAIKKAKTLPCGKMAAVLATGRLLKIHLRRKKHPMEALESAESLLRIDPFNLRFITAHCGAAEAAGLPEVALQTLEIIQEHLPPSIAVLAQLARLHRQAAQYDLEYECLKKIAELRPTDATVQSDLKNAAARLTMDKAGWQTAQSYHDVMRPDRTDDMLR